MDKDDFFHGEEAMSNFGEYEHREKMYQAFKKRLVEELNLTQPSED